MKPYFSTPAASSRAALKIYAYSIEVLCDSFVVIQERVGRSHSIVVALGPIMNFLKLYLSFRFYESMIISVNFLTWAGEAEDGS